MTRRDQFLDLVNRYNNDEYFNREIETLEKYIDTELLKEEVIIQFINDSDLGSVAGTSGNILNVVTSIKTPTIHRDDNVNSTNGKKNGNYYIWDEDSNLFYSNGDIATNEPWSDKTIKEQLNASIRIDLPANTNKFVARMFINRLLSTDPTQFNSDGILQSGFWSLIVKPVPNTNTINPDAITLEYNKETKILTLIFKIV
jgi:hypothetical protein